MTASRRRLAIGMVVTALVLAVVVEGLRRATPTEANVEVLGTRAMAVGDTATWCGLVTMTDGSMRLGRELLEVEAIGPDVVRLVRSAHDVAARCAPLLRRRGITTTLPLSNVSWSVREREAQL